MTPAAGLPRAAGSVGRAGAVQDLAEFWPVDGEQRRPTIERALGFSTKALFLVLVLVLLLDVFEHQDDRGRLMEGFD